MNKNPLSITLVALSLILPFCGQEEHGTSKTETQAPKYSVNTAVLPAEMTPETKTCVACHMKENKSMYQQWGSSKHYGANVGCYECHAAQSTDPDAFEHHGRARVEVTGLPFPMGAEIKLGVGGKTKGAALFAA